MAKKESVKRPAKKQTKKKKGTNAVAVKGAKQSASPLAKKLASGKPTNQDQPEAKKKTKPFAKKGAVAKKKAPVKKTVKKKPAPKKKGKK